jgi:putative transposase
MNLLAFVVMPEHLHLLCQPLDKDISLIMRHIKRNSSFNICRLLNIKAPIWVKRFHDEVMTTYDGVIETINYIHLNPVTRGLVERPEDYPFSSAYQGFELDWEGVL